MVVELTDSNFDEIVNNTDKPIVIDLWAEWCGPCRMITPIMEDMDKEYEDKAIITKLNVDENPETTGKFGVRNIPTVLFLKDGQVVDKQVGAVPKQVLTGKLEALL
ncbi:MAG: thioredoxin [Bacteroidales bacterium]|nr:thioredoxin [Bacteroidales bacterium]MCF8328593.1 thioredoxin [Bacteroidales bacterium]